MKFYGCVFEIKAGDIDNKGYHDVHFHVLLLAAG